MNNVVTCASYGGTGSSAITDILKEFDNIKSFGDFEFSFLHEVDGISDLQHYLLDDWHRLKNDEAIYRFKRLVDRISWEYDKFFEGQFSVLTKQYINSLVKLEWDGYWHQHRFRYNKLTRKIKYNLPMKIQLKLKNIFVKSNYEFSTRVPVQPMYFVEKRYDFIEITKEYINNLLDVLNKNRYEFLALDQLLTPNSIERYSRYFNNIKVIIVDRDPRDLYLLNELYWKEKWIPSHDIDIFIEWFKSLRKYTDYNLDNVMKIYLEDLIFNYDESMEKIYSFLGVSYKNHIRKKEYFNPEISIKNCRLWENNVKYEKEIIKIKESLSDFLYN